MLMLEHKVDPTSNIGNIFHETILSYFWNQIQDVQTRGHTSTDLARDAQSTFLFFLLMWEFRDNSEIETCDRINMFFQNWFQPILMLHRLYDNEVKVFFDIANELLSLNSSIDPKMRYTVFPHIRPSLEQSPQFY